VRRENGFSIYVCFGYVCVYLSLLHTDFMAVIVNVNMSLQRGRNKTLEFKNMRSLSKLFKSLKLN